MSDDERRMAAARLSDHLLVQLLELERLREKVKEAEISAQKNHPTERFNPGQPQDQ